MFSERVVGIPLSECKIQQTKGKIVGREKKIKKANYRELCVPKVKLLENSSCVRNSLEITPEQGNEMEKAQQD